MITPLNHIFVSSLTSTPILLAIASPSLRCASHSLLHPTTYPSNNNPFDTSQCINFPSILFLFLSISSICPFKPISHIRLFLIFPLLPSTSFKINSPHNVSQYTTQTIRHLQQLHTLVTYPVHTEHTTTEHNTTCKMESTNLFTR